MPYIFSALLLISIILLIIGFIRPQSSLFWYKGDRSKQKSLRFYGIAVAVAISGVALTVPDIPKEEKTIVKVQAEKSIGSETSPTATPVLTTVTFDYNLPGSEYAIPVTLGNIETINKKNAFAVKKEEYVPESNEDGYIFSFTFTLTNTYDKELLVPIPDDFYITAPNDEFFTDQKKWDRSCECNISDVDDITIEGVELKSYTSTRCGAANNYCVKMKPGQVIHGKTSFGYPVLGSVRKLLLHGFYRSDYDGRKMAYDKCWPINVDAKSFGTEALNK